MTKAEERRKKAMEIGHVVKEFKIGNTRVRICDDACRDKTPKEVQEIIDRIQRRALEEYRAAGMFVVNNDSADNSVS